MSSAANSDLSPDWERALDLLSRGNPVAKARQFWRKHGRPEQQTPPGAWNVWLILAGRGFGKAVSLDCPLPVYNNQMLSSDSAIPSSGWKRMGDIQVGDMVFDESGRPCRVTAIHDRTPKVAYRLHFSDGTHIDACDEHQWVTWTHAERKAYLRSQHEADRTRFPAEWPTWRASRLPTRFLSRETVERALELHAAGVSARKIERQLEVSRQALAPHLAAGQYIERTARATLRGTGPRIRTTQDIVDTLTFGKRGDTNHAIPTCEPLQLPRAELPIDPWVLGYWLGDGYSNSAELAVGDNDIAETVDRLRGLGLQPKVSEGSTCWKVTLYGGIRPQLRALGLLGDKHIPDRYLWASVEQREALLHGLMDSDGYAGNSHVEFCTTKRRLADQVMQLARSLGQKPRLGEGRATLDGRDCGPKYRVVWRPTRQPFSMARKAALVDITGGAQGLRNHHRMIVAAERIDPVPMRCITVGSPHHMFLVGEAMIPTHNTRTGAEDLADYMVSNPGARCAIIAPTFADARDTCVEGESGLLSVLERYGFKQDANLTWNRSLGELKMPNGSQAKLFSAEKPGRLRGPQHHRAWVDELAQVVKRDPDTWDQMMFGLRLGQHPQVVVTTTPLPVAKVRELINRAAEDVHLTKGSTYDNAANLAAPALDELRRRYEGTRLGRQELHAEVLDDIPGALWQRVWIDADRVHRAPELVRTVVAVDPAVTSGENADETGILVAGQGTDGHYYVLADRAVRTTPLDWAGRVVAAYEDFDANEVVIETNQGGDALATLLRQIEPGLPIRQVHAKKGKRVRAEPVSALYEQHKVHHVGPFDTLEDQLCTWTPEEVESPDRMDALVYALLHLAQPSHAAAFLTSITTNRGVS